MYKTSINSIGNFLIWSELDAVNRAGELLPGKNQPIQWLTWLLRIPTILQCLHFRTGLFTKVMHFENVIWHRSHHIICLKVGYPSLYITNLLTLCRVLKYFLSNNFDSWFCKMIKDVILERINDVWIKLFFEQCSSD